ncbi:hypothetical protein G7Z17_g4145 [Cylindrodendrum hubeiense]|uniref:PAN-3 domain-containing protein n=1 Tax=Cylindrodendrum hubeiense TaxID=595255 RepID=A0A9P5LIK9_9HYPO|nr:hypothetical protein G7Z17_g4145 [Cylindrodendrum hubeiense]
MAFINPRTLLAAVLLVASSVNVSAGICKPTVDPSTFTHTCSEGRRSRAEKRLVRGDQPLCDEPNRLTNLSYQLGHQQGLTWEECATWCYETDMCTAITSDINDNCAIWRGTHEEAGIASQTRYEEYLSDITCFTCWSIVEEEERR